MKWKGNYAFVVRNLVLKDFRIRYRNMSLGVFWSLLNPLVMMGVLTFIFTKIYPNKTIHDFPVFVMCGLVPFNFFAMAWSSSTNSLVDGAALIKRVSFPREVIPIASVLSTAVHLSMQILLLLAMTLLWGKGVNVHWFWLPVIWGLVIFFACGLGLVCAGLNVYIRDMRYVVESATNVLFWLVPIFYSPDIIPQRYVEIYRLNPLAALVWAQRFILLDDKSPPATLLWKLAISSCGMLAFGLLVFQKLKRRFYNYL